jgi:hypothetical protein
MRISSLWSEASGFVASSTTVFRVAPTSEQI